MQVNPMCEEFRGGYSTATALKFATITATGTTAVDNYSEYKALLIIIKGDSNNGNTWIVPKPLYNVQIPLYVSSKNNEPANDGGGYSIAYHGFIVNGVLNNNYVQFSGWTGIQIQVYGLN